jgi:hypothetical protein
MLREQRASTRITYKKLILKVELLFLRHYSTKRFISNSSLEKLKISVIIQLNSNSFILT